MTTLTVSRSNRSSGPTLTKPVDSDPGSRPHLLQRDRAAFESAIHQHTPGLLRAAKRILRNDEDAADAVQDTFLQAFLSIESFQGRSSFYTWLYRILVNNCLMRMRASVRRRCVSLQETADSQPWMTSEEANDSQSVLSQQAEQEELAQMVRHCIEALPTEYREVIMLRDIKQLGTRQTALKLCISTGAVKTRLHRARRALRRFLDNVTHGLPSQNFSGNLALA